MVPCPASHVPSPTDLAVLQVLAVHGGEAHLGVNLVQRVLAGGKTLVHFAEIVAESPRLAAQPVPGQLPAPLVGR